MKRCYVGLALLFTSLTLTAQQNSAPSGRSFGRAGVEPSQSPKAQVASLACPVDMQAQQRGNSQFVAVRNGQRSPTPGQRIALTLRGTQSPRAISARVKVRGLTAKGRVLQSKGTETLASEISQSMTVVFNEGSNGGVTGELSLPGFTSVTAIELEEITYENGTLWKVDERSICRVAPDPFMLISGR